MYRYRPQVRFVQDGLSADGEQLLEMLSSANLDTDENKSTASTSNGAASYLRFLCAFCDAATLFCRLVWQSHPVPKSVLL